MTDYGSARALGRDQVDPGVARAAMSLFRELPAAAPDSVLLVTDLHHDNVLASEREPWLAIDPKPYTGDPAYDVLQHMLNFPERCWPRTLAGSPPGWPGWTGLVFDAGGFWLWLSRPVRAGVSGATSNLQAVAAGWRHERRLRFSAYACSRSRRASFVLPVEVR